MSSAHRMRAGELTAIVASLTAIHVTDAERIEQLEAELRVARNDAVQLQTQLNNRAASFDDSEKDNRRLRRQLEASEESLSRVKSTGHALIDSASALLRLQKQQSPAPVQSDARKPSSSEETLAIAQANFGSMVNAYSAASRQIEDVATVVQSLALPLENFCASIGELAHACVTEHVLAHEHYMLSEQYPHACTRTLRAGEALGVEFTPDSEGQARKDVEQVITNCPA